MLKRASPDALTHVEMESALQAALQPLRRFSYHEACSLPEFESTTAKIRHIPVTIGIYRELSEVGDVSVIAQLSTVQKRFLWFFRTSQVLARGFKIGASSSIVDLPERELYFYM